jgi:ABC-type branched-subunit amino acid transport system substrate-binding protein
VLGITKQHFSFILGVEALHFPTGGMRQNKTNKINGVKGVAHYLAVLLVLLIGLWGLPVNAEEKQDLPLPPASDAFGRAEYYFHSGDLLKAQAFYQNFVKTRPKRTRGEKALFRLGEIEQLQKSYTTALRFYRILLRQSPNTYLIHDLRFNMAICYFELDQNEEARNFYQEVAQSHPDRNKRWQAQLFLGRIQEKEFDYRAAIAQLRKLIQQNENPQVNLQAEALIQDIIEKKISKTKAIALAQVFRNEFPADQILLRLIAIYRAERDLENLRTTALDFLRLFPEHSKNSQIREMLKSMAMSTDEVIRLGAILPLSGKLALTGQKVLQGIQLAVNHLGRSTTLKLELVVKDSASGKGIAQLVESLAMDPNLVGIIGPVLSENVIAATAMAEKYKVPLFTPTASTLGLTESSDYVFRNALTRDIEARFLADYAVNRLGLRRIAILYPLEAYGFELRDRFASEVTSLGAEIVTQVPYDRSQTDFKEQILELGGVSDDKLKRLVKQQALDGIKPEYTGDELSQPKIDLGLWTEKDIEDINASLELNYDGIFIPGFYDKVGLILPQLAFYNVEGVTLLGARGWNSPELVKIAGNYLQSGHFVDGFFAGSGQKNVQGFVNRFKTTFGGDPSIYSAQSYDSAGIYIHIIGEGASNRLTVRERLKEITDYPGVSGKTSILSTGDSTKDLFTLQVKRKKIIEKSLPIKTDG